jgi:flagellar hook protein FlgE
MRIESALNASRQGIDAHGKAIAVIGDNISNSSTVGFKASRVEFSDLLATGENGTEPSSIPETGSGAMITKVRPMHQTGVIEFSGRALDMAIDGDGFFMIGTPESPKFTKAGNFEINAEGILADSKGNPVLGFTGADGAALGPIDMVNINLNGEPTNQGTITGNLSSLSAVGEVPENPETFAELGKAAAFSSSIGAFDSLGAEHDISLFYFKTDVNTWTVQAYVDGADVGGEAGTPTAVGELQIEFDPTTGEPTVAEPVMNVQAQWAGAAAGNIAIDFSGMSQFAASSGITNVTRNGQSAGSIKGYELDSNGGIFANLSSGSRVQVGTIQLGNVRNVDGLDRVGDNSFKETTLTGDRTTGTPGANGFGNITPSALERSTVDISKEFVDLVLFQRGYQANSQLLNAANDIIRDTISLMR